MTRVEVDGLTVAAAGLLAMCIVSVAHEALGHGGMCLALGGHIEVLTSSIFRCDMRSGWIDPAGPLVNVLTGGLAVGASNRMQRRWVALRLLLTLVAAFSFFWESGYLVKAMLIRDGDLYFAARALLGEPSSAWRIVGVGVGVIFYLITARWVAGALTGVLASGRSARQAARIAWGAATLGAGAAAFLNVAHGWGGLRDATLEVGAASLPLLLIGGTGSSVDECAGPPSPRRSGVLIGVSLVAYAAFAATLGRGLYF